VVRLFFNSDFGDSSRALGWYDNETDTINVNLEGIFVGICLEFYGLIPEPPIRFQHPIQFHECLAFTIVKTISHEWIHKILYKVEGEECSLMYDTLPSFRGSSLELNVWGF